MSENGSITTGVSNRKRDGYRECDDPESADSPNGIDHYPPETVTWRDRVAHFTWPWFACTMSTGALAVVLGQTPNTFTGLQTIGKIFFILALVLFVAFTAIIITRFILVPQKFLASLHHPVESLFFGSYWVTISLLLNCIQLYGVPNTGPWLVKALEILFWMYVAAVLIVGIGQYYVLFQLERLKVNNAMPAWIFPIYPLLVIGPLAGTIIPSQPHTAAVPIWLAGVMLQGMGWCVALMMYAIYTQRLMVSALPDPSTRPGMYVSVGPAGYTAAALISLGRQAPAVFERKQFFGITSLLVEDVIKVLGIMAGLFLLLFSFWFFCVSTVSVIAGAKQMSFTLNWWAFVFPNAGMTLATIQAGGALSSAGINGLCSALTIALVIMWFFTAIAHILAVRKGQVMWPGKDEDKTMNGIRWGAHAA
ncbi:malic acid transporter [Aureobasidium pullulans]|uniref:Malic acid transporter n=2 Tax=Aureobasidium pullulans TaxID=5580 RepID=A0AB38M4Z1_AURPU|nr:malic acid transporter [Aureobasidium pullulans]THZ43287.1 malic acid transporter [Aureobasidium pullulans]